MTYKFEKLTDGIYRLCFPFEITTTCVFALVEDGYTIILDSGTNKSDVDNIIIPAITEQGFAPHLFLCSHLHPDHAGGVRDLLKHYTSAEVGLYYRDIEFSGTKINFYNDGDILCNRFQLLNLKGHTADGLAVFEQKTKTVLTADCLQLCGLEKYCSHFGDYAEYIKTINRIRALNPHRIVTSHEYEPFGAIAEGEAEVKKYLDKCEWWATSAKDFVKRHPQKTPEQIAELFSKANSDYPPIGLGSVVAIIKELNKERI